MTQESPEPLAPDSAERAGNDTGHRHSLRQHGPRAHEGLLPERDTNGLRLGLTVLVRVQKAGPPPQTVGLLRTRKVERIRSRESEDPRGIVLESFVCRFGQLRHRHRLLHLRHDLHRRQPALRASTVPIGGTSAPRPPPRPPLLTPGRGPAPARPAPPDCPMLGPS